MIKELVIHLGDHKTGSTSIQNALRNRSWRSSESEICFPAALEHNNLAKALGRKKDSGLARQHGERIRKRLMQTDAEIGIISAEEFESVSPFDLKEFILAYLPEFQEVLRLILYLRPHAERLLSSFSERTKLGNYHGTLADFHNRIAVKGSFVYMPRIERWRIAFGSQLVVRPFAREQLYCGDVVEDFFKLVFREKDYTLTAASRKNESLCLRDLVMLREAHDMIRNSYGRKVSRAAHEIFGRRFGAILSERNREGDKVAFHSSLSYAIKEFYHLDAIALDGFFANGGAMSIALDTCILNAVGEEQSLDIANYYTQNEILQIRCWSEMIGYLISTNQEIFTLATIPPSILHRIAGG